MTDEKLIENIKQDDNTALNCLLERYNDVVNMKANKFSWQEQKEKTWYKKG